MHNDFLIDYFGLPTNNGVNYFIEERIAQYIAALEPTGFDFHIHGIGNRGTHESLNAIEQSGTSVSSLNPFIGMENAVTRAPQNISLEEAIKAYTINAAYVMRQENTTGSIEVNKAADFIILDRNLLEINTNQISNVKVDKTYLNGKLVYER